ncbi:LAGLIDADG-like domain protein [uncultured archaeon]|nr:LAGLIDADG-like domain protein [uncultured archaeon]
MINKIDIDMINRIKEIRKKGNFQTMKKVIGENELKQFFNTIYPKCSITELEGILEVSDSTLQHWFSRLGMPMVRNHISNLTYPADFNSQIVIQERNGAKKVSAVNITPELAYIIGFSLGDGSIQKYAVEVFNRDNNLRKHLFDLLRPYGTITVVDRDDGLWKLRLSNVKIANLIKDERGVREDTLDYIFADECLARQFIAAFWDAEGTVRKQDKYFHLYLYNSNHDIIQRISKFLKANGIELSISERKTRDKDFVLNGRLVKSKKTMQRISIPKSAALRWVELIGTRLLHSKKRNTVNEILKVYGGK